MIGIESGYENKKLLMRKEIKHYFILLISDLHTNTHPPKTSLLKLTAFLI